MCLSSGNSMNNDEKDKSMYDIRKFSVSLFMLQETVTL